MNRLGEMLRGMMQEMNDKMDANMQLLRGDLQATSNRMDEMRGDMRTQRGEMQCMELSLQAGQEAIRAIARGEMRTIDCKMAAPRGGATEPTRGSANCIRPAMETGEVRTTSDATTIDGETCRTRHEGMTEKLK